MTKKEQQNPFTSCISVSQKFFGIAVFCIFLFGVVAGILYPDERDTIDTDCRLFNPPWERVLDTGERIPVELPGKVAAEYGEPVTLVTSLPENLQKGEMLCFRAIWQDVDIYIDGELRESYTTKDSRPFGINSTMRYITVALNESDSGKELTYISTSFSKYTGDMRDSYIGDLLSIWMHFFETSGTQTIVALFLLLLSLLCIIICFILKYTYKKPLALAHLAWTLFLCSFWMLSEVPFRQLVVKNISILSSFTYWTLMLIPIPLLTFMNEIQTGRYQKLFALPIIYSSVTSVLGTVLQVFDIVQFVQFVSVIHIGIILAILCIIITITLDTFRKYITDYLFVGIGIYGMLLTAIIEMILYYMGAIISLGTILAIGLLFLLIMAIIKTGQDLFYSEKKKQQAIVAREAQAKFLANMSHEIRTPINAIIGMNEMILRENTDTAVEEYALNIQNASTMLLGLVNDVLDFTKIESGQLELVEDNYSLPQLLQDERLLLQARASGKPISTMLDVAPDLPTTCIGDELRIKQILTNLLSNAVKYTQQGMVTLKAFSIPIEKDMIQLCFSVIDTGIGIRPEDRSKLFDSFKRLELNKNRNIQGTGLGLNIAKQLTEQMNGTITVSSEYGKGSTFTVRIPQRVVNSKPIGDFEITLKQFRTEKQISESLFTAPDASVLIVDDNTINLTLMKSLLKRTLIRTDTASSGRECLKLAKQHKYDIIFMDHMMPDLDGVETLRMLRADQTNPNQNTIVIALTANAIAGCREMYLNYGFNDYFSKPVQSDKLEQLLIQHLPEAMVHTKQNTLTNPPETASKVSSSSPDTSTASLNLLEINRTTGLSYCGESEELYQEILAEFASQTNTFQTQLEEAYQTQNWKNYAITAHSIKSTARTIGATNLAELSLQHELAGKETNTEFITANYMHYTTALIQLAEYIRQNLLK